LDQTSAGQQHLDHAVEILIGIVRLQVEAQFGDAARHLFARAASVATSGSYTHRRQGRAVLKAVGGFVRLKPEV